MGIKDLSKLIAEHAPQSIKEYEMVNYCGRNRKVAIDASLALYQFMLPVRQDGHLLTNEAGDVTSHLLGIFYSTIRMVDNGIKPVWVFDGKPSELKSVTLAKRRERREGAEKDLEEAKEVGGAEEVDKFTRRLVRVTKEHNEEAKSLLTLMGVPYLEAPSEAGAQCAALVREGIVYATATEDLDALTFASPVLLRHMTFSETKKMPIQEFDLQRVLGAFDMDQDQFIDLCILLGCDYCDTIRGLDPEKAFDLITRHRNIDLVLKNLDPKKYPVPVDWPYKVVRQYFQKPEVTPTADVVLTWDTPDEAGLVAYLCRKGFKEDDLLLGGIAKLKEGLSWQDSPTKKKGQKSGSTVQTPLSRQQGKTVTTANSKTSDPGVKGKVTTTLADSKSTSKTSLPSFGKSSASVMPKSLSAPGTGSPSNVRSQSFAVVLNPSQLHDMSRETLMWEYNLIADSNRKMESQLNLLKAAESRVMAVSDLNGSGWEKDAQFLQTLRKLVRIRLSKTAAPINVKGIMDYLCIGIGENYGRNITDGSEWGWIFQQPEFEDLVGQLAEEAEKERSEMGEFVKGIYQSLLVAHSTKSRVYGRKRADRVLDEEYCLLVVPGKSVDTRQERDDESRILSRQYGLSSDIQWSISARRLRSRQQNHKKYWWMDYGRRTFDAYLCRLSTVAKRQPINLPVLCGKSKAVGDLYAWSCRIIHGPSVYETSPDGSEVQVPLEDCAVWEHDIIRSVNSQFPQCTVKEFGV